MGLDHISLVSAWWQLCCRERVETNSSKANVSVKPNPLFMQINVLQSYLEMVTHLPPECLAKVRNSIILQQTIEDLQWLQDLGECGTCGSLFIEMQNIKNTVTRRREERREGGSMSFFLLLWLWLGWYWNLRISSINYHLVLSAIFGLSESNYSCITRK